MDRLYKEVDILSFHVPLTEETHGLYNFDFFNNFEKELYLVNTARGPILPLIDLIRLLDNGKILGAALDVLEKEKLSKFTSEEKARFSNLIERDNVVFTPHVGGWSYESYKRINDTLVRKIVSLHN